MNGAIYTALSLWTLVAVIGGYNEATAKNGTCPSPILNSTASSNTTMSLSLNVTSVGNVTLLCVDANGTSLATGASSGALNSIPSLNNILNGALQGYNGAMVTTASCFVAFWTKDIVPSVYQGDSLSPILRYGLTATWAGAASLSTATNILSVPQLSNSVPSGALNPLVQIVTPILTQLAMLCTIIGGWYTYPRYARSTIGLLIGNVATAIMAGAASSGSLFGIITTRATVGFYLIWVYMTVRIFGNEIPPSRTPTTNTVATALASSEMPALAIPSTVMLPNTDIPKHPETSAVGALPASTVSSSNVITVLPTTVT